MITQEERISTLRRRCMDRKTLAWRDIAVPMARSLRESESVQSWQERRGLCTRDVLASLVLEVDDLEILMGRLAPRPLEISDSSLEASVEYLKKYPSPWGQTGHCELFLRPLFDLGIDALRESVESKIPDAEGESASVYRSFCFALDGLSALIENAATCAEKAIASSQVERQAALGVIADCCKRIAHQPPQSFRDAIQLLWFATFAVQQGETVWLIAPGHLDRSLYSYYRKDIDEGRITREDALLLIESFYILINEYVPDHLAVPVMVGGRDAMGRDVTNDLSYLCLEALGLVKLVYPTVGVCWHEGTPDELVNLAIDLIRNGYSNPAFFGDETIQKGLRDLGVPADESCDYINSTCVEITPVASSNVWVASPYFNLCGHLLEEISEQSLTPATSFDFFTSRYKERLSAIIERAVDEQNGCRIQRREYGRKPLQSLFTRDCLDRGKDIDDGGARYNWVECSFVGLANLADSLHVIREEIFNKRTMTFAEIKKILDANFENHEDTRLRFLNAYPKYGQDHFVVDDLVASMVSFVTDECRKHKINPDGSHFVPGAFVWIMHEWLGRGTGATPDGRKAGTPFADGAGPAQGRESKGPTAAILSTTRWDHSPLIGGVAFNMKFSASLFDSREASDSLRDLVLSYLRRGGFETQINVVDREVLKRAREHPDEYRDLVVRIGGYTDYFTKLSPEMQDEIMLRTEYTRV